MNEMSGVCVHTCDAHAYIGGAGARPGTAHTDLVDACMRACMPRHCSHRLGGCVHAYLGAAHTWESVREHTHLGAVHAFVALVQN